MFNRRFCAYLSCAIRLVNVIRKLEVIKLLGRSKHFDFIRQRAYVTGIYNSINFTQHLVSRQPSINEQWIYIYLSRTGTCNSDINDQRRGRLCEILVCCRWPRNAEMFWCLLNAHTKSIITLNIHAPL